MITKRSHTIQSVYNLNDATDLNCDPNNTITIEITPAKPPKKLINFDTQHYRFFLYSQIIAETAQVNSKKVINRERKGKSVNSVFKNSLTESVN